MLKPCFQDMAGCCLLTGSREQPLGVFYLCLSICFITLPLYWPIKVFSILVPSPSTLLRRGVTELLDGFFISRRGEPTRVVLTPSMGHEITRVLYEVCYSGYSASSSYAGHRDCWLHCLSLCLVELENMLIKTISLSFALAFLALLFWRKYLVESMRK